MAREMKDSGIEWIGEIPETWKIIKLKYLFSIIGGNGFPDGLQGYLEGDYPFCKVSDINGSEVFIDIAANYVSGKYVTQLSDAESGKIIIKPVANFTFNQSIPAECNYTLTISIKDGKVRAVIDQLYSEHTPNSNYPGWGYAEEWLEGKANGYKQPSGSLKRLSMMANALADHIDGIFASLEQYLSSQTEEEDW